jgi:ArsR family transcriptional regulator
MSTDPNPTSVPVSPLRLSRTRRMAILKALADPRRFELLEQIARASCPLGCAQARAELAVSPATLSHHIKELETAGLIRVKRQGKFHFLSLRPGILEALAANLSALQTTSCQPPDPKA